MLEWRADPKLDSAIILVMSSASTTQAAIPRPAATLILVREGPAAPEVLLMKRGAGARFMPGAYVFAGGGVDALDSSPEAYALSPDLSDERASAILKVDQHGLAYYVAAVREALEECGLLLAYEADGSLVRLSHWEEEALHGLRNRLNRQHINLPQLCREHGWHLALERLYYFAHWITPPGSKLRFDTRFFICRAPDHQSASLASEEMSALVWRTAAEALDEGDAGHITLVHATREMLKEIAAFAQIHTLLEYARQPRDITTVLPTFPVSN
jgi:8-oxo-dGTP pyrophosphatase MutT (NUDIX family)